jgi:hypothetical protein
MSMMIIESLVESDGEHWESRFVEALNLETLVLATMIPWFSELYIC